MKRKTVRRSNALFLSLILVYFILEMAVLGLSMGGVELGLISTIILSQATIIIPGLIFIVAYKLDFRKWVPFKKIKWSVFFLSILFTMCISPFATWLNIVSQLFTKSVVAELTEDILSGSPVLILLMIGVVGPFCEEFVFRGVIFSGLKHSGRIFASILVSALFFGLMHMNLNQFFYAFALGIAFAFLREATGSLIPCLISHMLVNSSNMMLEYIADFVVKLTGEGAGLAEMVSETEPTKNDLLFIAGVYLIPAILGLALSVVVYIAICKRSGTLSHITDILKKKTPLAEDTGLEGLIPDENVVPDSFRPGENTSPDGFRPDENTSPDGLAPENSPIASRVLNTQENIISSVDIKKAEDNVFGKFTPAVDEDALERESIKDGKPLHVITLSGYFAIAICLFFMIATGFFIS